MLKNTAIRRTLAPALLTASITTATLAAAPPAEAAAPTTSTTEPPAAASEPVVFTPDRIVPTPEPKPEPKPEAKPKPTPESKPAPAAPAPKAAAAPKKAATAPARKAAPPARKAPKRKKAWTLPVKDYVLTGRFGRSGARWASTHGGLDFAAPQGTRIRSIGTGRVISRYFHSAYGNMTVVRQKRGTIIWYCHQSRQVAKVGQKVKAGDTIGRVGSTGNSTGPHVHVEVHTPHRGAVDPDTWLEQRGLNP